MIPKFEFRAKKVSPNKDDFKVLIVGIFVAILIMMSSLVFPRFVENRWYRDLINLTPFRNVELLYSEVSEDRISIILGGTLIKIRCQFHALYGYIHMDNGIKYPVMVDTHRDPFGAENRPPSTVAESWGPWTLDMSTNIQIPENVSPISWEIIAEHIRCPSEPETQRNLFIEGPWMDVNNVQ